VLNREHVAMPAIEALLGMRAAVVERIRDVVQNWKPAALHVVVFGSMARADGGTESDIDLLIVRLDEVDAEDGEWRRQVAELEDSVRRWTGNRAQPIELALSDALEMVRRKHGLLQDIERDGIVVAGWPLSQLLTRTPAGTDGKSLRHG
jgi:predicted nucleotidyltransferase